MKKLLATAVLACVAQFALTSAAFADQKADCEAKAISKSGKPLAGAAKSKSVQKCMGGGAAKPAEKSGCAAKAVGSNGKPLVGAARSSFMKKCQAESK